jgi:hypothetical protein
MNARIQAAAKALATKDRTNFSSWHREEATEALSAADAVMFSDEAMERAAKALLDAFYADPTLEVDDEDRDIIRTVVAALKGDA